jgi:hypothetical protein
MFPRLSPDVQQWLDNTQESENGWDAKRIVHVEELGLSTTETDHPVMLIIVLKVFDGMALSVKPVEPRDALFLMAASLNDLTTGKFMLTDATGHLLGLPFHDLFGVTLEQRRRALEAVTPIPTARIRGCLADIIDYLQQEWL